MAEKIIPITVSVKATRNNDTFIGLGRSAYLAGLQAAQDWLHYNSINLLI